MGIKPNSTIEEVEKKGAQVRSATANYDPKTAQGKFACYCEIRQ